jgi:hypothetical protein
MPAIELARLQREVEHLQSVFDSPAELSRAVLDVLGFYADRARRPSTPVAAEEHTRGLRVPAPVVRAIGMGLQQKAAGNPDRGWEVADALWQTDLREPRILACWVLSGFADEHVADWLEARAAELDDRVVMASVVDRAVLHWRSSSGRNYIDRVEGWLVSPRSAVQALGLRALGAGLDMPEAEDMHRAFQALGRLPGPVRGDARDAFRDLLETLAERSPAETTRFLLEEIEAGQPGIDQLVRSLLTALPSAQQERLMAVISPRRRHKTR